MKTAAHPSRATTAELTASPENGPATGGRLRILLAEDDPTVRDLLVIMLRRRGWDVVSAADGRQAVAKWEEGAIDLIVMDLRMPEMDGLSATRMIRSLEGAAGRTPILALTANALPEDRRNCLAAGMDGFLRKPIRCEDLYRAVEKLAG